MGNAAMTESIGVNPTPAVSMGGAPVVDGVTGDETAMGEAREAATSGGPVLQLTKEEWQEQADLLLEYTYCITRDKARADELRPRIICPASVLKTIKRMMGANYIRKEGYNTIEADLVYGPGWLDEDDGGPECSYSEDYKPLGKYELPRRP